MTLFRSDASLSARLHLSTERTSLQHLRVQQHYLLVLRSTLSDIGVQAKPPERVVEEGSPDGHFGLPVPHAIVELDDLLLQFGEVRMRANLQYDMLLPILIRGTVPLAVPAHACLENARQDEVLKHLVGVAVVACWPSEPTHTKN